MDGDDPPTRLHLLGKAARVALLVWLGLLIFLGLTQRSMIYFPHVTDERSLEQEALAINLFPWRDTSGKVIGFCNVAPASGLPRASVIIFHGNAGYAAHRVNYVRILREALPNIALSIYILEYPGYGARGDVPSQDTLIAAARESVGLIPSHERLLLLGESLGSGVACAIGAEEPERVHGLLLLTPFDCLASVARYHYPLLPVGWILRDTYPAAEWLRNFRGPCVFVVAAEDNVIPHEIGVKLYEAYGGSKKLITVQRATHNDLADVMTPSDWRDALEFILLK